MITYYDYSKHFVSLTTLSSPHNGLSVFDRRYLKNNIFEEGLLERPLMAVGMSVTNYKEFTKPNMRDFNDFSREEPNMLYYSVGAK